MRIISGKFKGSSLHMPLDKNTRPLKDLARESIFNLLKHSNKITFKFEKSIILDLYSGTGSFGLECISRDAKNVYFVENDKEAINVLEKNIKKLKVEKNTKIFFNNVFEFVEKKDFQKLKFDLIFCDPPFKFTNVQELFELIFGKNLLNKNGTIILHRNKITIDKFPDYFKIIEERIYGISKIVFGKFIS